MKKKDPQIQNPVEAKRGGSRKEKPEGGKEVAFCLGLIFLLKLPIRKRGEKSQERRTGAPGKKNPR